jgi:hypothetical protein
MQIVLGGKHMSDSLTELRHDTQGTPSPNRVVAARLLVMALLALSVAACGASKVAPGFCVAQNRYLTDEDYIRIAIRDQFNSNLLNISGSEESVKEFHKKHPKCCGVNRQQDSVAILNKFNGQYVVDVEVHFEVKPERLPAKGPYYEGHALIHVCGEIDSTYGTDSEKLQEVADQP